MVGFIESHLEIIGGTSSKPRLNADASSLAAGSRMRETSPLSGATFSLGLTDQGRMPVIHHGVNWNCIKDNYVDLDTLKERVKIVRNLFKLRDFRYRTCSERKKTERLIRRYMYREWRYKVCFQCVRSLAYSPSWVHSLQAATRATV